MKICNSATSLLPEADDSRSWTSASQLLAEQLFSDSCSIWTTKKLKLAYRYLIPELVFLTTGNSVADPDKLKKNCDPYHNLLGQALLLFPYNNMFCKYNEVVVVVFGVHIFYITAYQEAWGYG